MKKILRFAKKKRPSSATPDSGSLLSFGYDLKDKDLGKVHKAAAAGDLEKLKRLAKKNDLNQLDRENRTVLHITCASGHAEVVQFLVESKAKLNLCDNQNRSALMKAVQCQHERCVKILLENHADPNLVDINGNTALHFAAHVSSASTAALLLEHEADINAQNTEAFTPLTVAVREDHIEMAEFLLKEGADVNFMDQDQRTPLMMAAGNGQISMLRLLLRFDADISLKDNKGWSADDYAVMNGHHPCSLLIIEHSTQRNNGQSMLPHGLSTKKKSSLLGHSSQNAETGSCLDGAAVDTEDSDDNSQSESSSRFSKSAPEWSSSEEDESNLSNKKPQKVNLRKMIELKTREASALRVQRIPSLPKASPSSNALQNPVDPSPTSFPSRVSQITSTPHPGCRQTEESTGDENDENEEEPDDDDDEEEEEDISEGNDREEREPANTTSLVPETDVSKEKKRDFLSELGLDQGDEEADSWDSESCSENPKMSHEEKQSISTPEVPPVREDRKDNLYYIPSFLRGEVCNRMAGKPRADQAEVGDNDNGENVDENKDTRQKETEKVKWEPLSVLNKLEGDKARKIDLMEELGLGDVDDLEDASDWDSASTTSKRTLPGCRMASPGLEEFPERSDPSEEAQDKDDVVSPPTKPQRSSSTTQRLLSPLRQPAPRVRKTAPQKPESEEESDWEPDRLTSSSTTDNFELQHTAELQAVVKPGSSEPSPTTKDSQDEVEPGQQQRKVCKETTGSGAEVQKSSASLDADGEALKDMRAEKPDSSSGLLSSQDGVQQEPLPVAPKSVDGAPLHLLCERSNSDKHEGETKQEISQPELVRGVRRATAPRTTPRVNGDPLSVFHDSSLSDVSDGEGRLTAGGRQQNKSPEQTEMAEDFDDITQSSDSATDDMDSPTSGYRHASLLVQKLDSATLDSRSMVKLQNIFHEYERSIQKAKGRHGYLSDKVVVLEMEKAELKRSLEEVKDLKSGLERDQLELQTEVTNLKFQLKQEQENGSNASMMYSSTRDKLRRMEEQQQLEVQEKQKVELSLRNLELEMGALVNNMKQMEEAHRETERLLDQERSARTLQENLLSSHLRKQQEMEEENRRNMSKSNEALSQLTEASDRERELLQQNASLQEQLNLLKADLERSQATSSLRERHLWEEKEALKEQLEDARRDLQLNSEALTQTGFSCNNQVTSLKSELSLATSRLENERQTRETLQAEAESTRTRLAGAVKEAELCLEARRDAERTLLREKEEHQRLKDRLTGEAASQREAVSSLSQKLSDAEARSNSMENEVHRVTLQLAEKGLLLDVLQREKDQTTARVKELEGAQQAERELFSRAGARQEATQERLAQAQSEAMLLRQQLEEAQNKGSAKERAVTDAQERFSDILTKLRSDCEERVQLMEERNKELVGKAAELRDQIYKLEEEKNEREAGLRLLQQELADALKKLSMSEASLEVNTRYRSDLEEEKARLLRDLDRLKGKLEESEDQYVQAEKRINGLKNALDHKEKELTSAAQKIQTALNASAASDTTVRQLEEAVQRLEIENARLEAAAKQQSHKIDALQKGAQEAAVVRGQLEDLVTNLQSSKMTLEDQLSREVQRQSTLTHTAQDSQALWEEELKSRSKLGLRLAELEKEKGDLSTQVEIEKKKAKKVVEQKKAVDTRLDEEMKRNAELQKEMYRMRTLLKTAKKKLRDQDVTGHEFGSPVSSLRTDLGRTGQSEGALGRMKDKVEDLQRQLDREASRRSQLEKSNDDLKDQLASLKGFGQNNEELERSKRQLEEEVLNLRRRLEACQVEQNQLDAYRRDVEERARQDVQQKLDQVNVFLQSQAASQEALDHMRENNEAFLRAQLKQRIQEMEGELDRARTIQRDNLNQRESSRLELEQYQQLYREELRLRKSLEAKLERVNCRLNEANSKLLSERSRSLLTSSLGGPSLHLDSLDSSSQYGASLGPLNRSLGLGVSMSGPVPERQTGGAEDFLTKVRPGFSLSRGDEEFTPFSFHVTV